MKWIRVRDVSTGHELSTPVGDPLIRKGVLRVVGRHEATSIPLPPKYKKNLPPIEDGSIPPAGGAEEE